MPAGFHPLPCTMAKAGTRTERELSLACLYPKSCFFVSPLLSTFSFLFSLSFQTHTKRKNKAMRIGVPVCVCTFRDFRVRDGHLKPFPSPKKRQISNKLLEEFQNWVFKKIFKLINRKVLLSGKKSKISWSKWCFEKNFSRIFFLGVCLFENSLVNMKWERVRVRRTFKHAPTDVGSNRRFSLPSLTPSHEIISIRWA